jgi:hypothetical protein
MQFDLQGGADSGRALQPEAADELTRRDSKSAFLRARAAGLDPGMRLDTWDETAVVA